jgi:hypothetical protein
MPQILRKQVLGRASKVCSRMPPRMWPRMRWSVLPLAVVSLAVLPTLVRAADPLPASVRACTAVPDVLQRLSCYDREVARYPAPQAKSATTGASAAPTPAPVPQTVAPQAAPPPPSASNTATPSALPAASGAKAAAPAADAAATDKSKHLVAHLVSIERLPNEMILHLDNGQVWQEVQSVSGDLSLREGDAVTIDKHFGSYWLSGPHVSSMKVRQKS